MPVFLIIFVTLFSPYVLAKPPLDLSLDFLKNQNQNQNQNQSQNQNQNQNNFQNDNKNILPELGDISSTELPIYQEREIGFQVLQSIRKTPSFLDDIFVLNYLNKIGKSLKNAQKKSEFDLTLFAINDSSVNAFALPGGYIGVNSGLILLAENESELAGVLSHEISHIEQRHIARKIYQSKKLTIPSLIAMGVAMAAAAASDNSGNVATAAISTTQAALAHNELAFSREFEQEADRFGFDLLRKSKFDAHGMADFFARLYSHNHSNELNSYAYLQTHPLTLQRLSDMQNREKVLANANSNANANTNTNKNVDLNFYFVKTYLDFLNLKKHNSPQQLLKIISTRNPKNFLENLSNNYELALVYFVNGDKNNAEKFLKLCQNQSEQLGKNWQNFLFLVDLQANLDNSPKIYENLLSKNSREIIVLYANFVLRNQNLQNSQNIKKLQNLDKLLDKQISSSKNLPNLTNLTNINKNFDFNLYYLFRLKAELSAVLGNFIQQNFYIANAMILEGKFQAALTQLEMIKNQQNYQNQNSKKENFYLLSQVEAKILQLKNYLKNNPPENMQ